MICVQDDLARMLETVDVLQDSVNSLRGQIQAQMDLIAALNGTGEPQHHISSSMLPDARPDVCSYHQVYAVR